MQLAASPLFCFFCSGCGFLFTLGSRLVGYKPITIVLGSQPRTIQSQCLRLLLVETFQTIYSRTRHTAGGSLSPQQNDLGSSVQAIYSRTRHAAGGDLSSTAK
jgi:hypothetical protein